ncbi:MAG: TIGR03960 family B12-binding radical SAM protein [Deltaproteobacteria bacterium]|nr:TIGR03960 family B12-binding radical SAM protein [Deltaproteobacteria bacterium]
MTLYNYPWFPKITRPSRYIGGEINSIKKDTSNTDLSIALAFPDVYDVGMSHLGLKILYHILNEKPWIAAERVFCPWTDLEQEMRIHNVGLTSLESDRPLSSFDIVGFSLQHELCYTNVLTMLDLSNIPLFARDRKDTEPLIIGGGPACFNPEPVADFFDLFLIGDGEDALVEICQTVKEAKRSGVRDRERILHELIHIRGVYIPSMFTIHYTNKGTVNSIEPRLHHYSFVEKAIVDDINKYPFPTKQVVPFTELVHDRVAIEIARGCTRGCRFCQAGMIYRPVRERNPNSILRIARDAIAATGYDEMSLLSLSSGDYSCIEPMLISLMDSLSSEKVAISLPSLRVDTLNPLLMEQIKRVRKTGFTIAVEAGNEDLQKVINKGLTQQDILKTAQAVYRAGWKLIKLYFMIGLPFEEEKDVCDIVDLAKQVVKLSDKGKKGFKLNVSVSTFVPKAHTPFMWESQLSLEESTRRINLIRERLRGTQIRVKWNEPQTSWLEGIFSRGDRVLANAVLKAWKLGARFDAWGDQFRKDIWDEAFVSTGVNPEFYLRKRGPDEILPWDHIRTGVSKRFLKQELEKATQRKFTEDCRRGCTGCGVCDQKKIMPVIMNSKKATTVSGNRSSDKPSSPANLPGVYRLTYTKLGRARFLGHLELVNVFLRAFRRSGIPLAYSHGFHPMPKVSFLSALPVGTESMCETADITVVHPISAHILKDRINRELPEGIAVNSVTRLPSGRKKPTLIRIHYLVNIEGADLLTQTDRLKRFYEVDKWPVEKNTKKGNKEVDIKKQVQSISIVSEKQVELVLRHSQKAGLKPDKIVRTVFMLPNINPWEIKVIKTRQIFS